METLRDVAVVGGGPAGLHAAYRLAAAGLDVVLFEAQPRIGEGAICSGVIGEEGFARFALPTQPVAAAIHCIQAVSPAGKILEHRNDGPLARVVDKGKFNRALAKRAVAASAEIRLGERVEWLQFERDSVALRVASTLRGDRRLEARVVVMASGVNCSLNRGLGLVRPGQLLRALQADVTVPGTEAGAPTRVYVGQAVAPGAFGWQIPLRDGSVRVGIMTTGNPKPYFSALLRRISGPLDESSVEVCQKGIAQAARGPCVRDRLVVIGEAAGHVKTSTGGGIYYGLLSADLASDVILRAFRTGDFTAVALSDFERYWRTAFGGELLAGYFARRLASRLPDSVIEKIFEMANAGRVLSRMNGDLQFDWHRKAILATVGMFFAVPGLIEKAG